MPGTDVEPPLLDHAPGVGRARLESHLLEQDEGGDSSLGVEPAGVEKEVRDFVGIFTSGSAAKLGRGALGGLDAVILRDDRLGQNFLGIAAG